MTSASAMGTETLPHRARSEDQQIEIFAHRRCLKVERSATLREGAKFSNDTLAIPAMSSECERVFSSAKNC